MVAISPPSRRPFEPRKENDIMSYLAARMIKLKSGQLSGIYNHNERVFKNHSNKDIDPEKSHLNYELTNRDHSQNYHKQIKEHINENRLSNRGIRKDAVLCNEWIITSDKTFFESLDDNQTREFFETAKDYFAEKYGESNIAYASVHLDERTPHMHLGIVPMKDGKLSSKALFGDKGKLRAIQDELPEYLKTRGYDLQRGEVGSKKKHLETAEFKEKQRLLEKTEKIIADKNSNIEVANKQLDELQSHIETKKQTLSELEDKEWETVGTLEQYEKEIQELAEFRNQKQTFEKFQLHELKKDNLVKRTIDGKLKLDKETFDKLYHTTRQSMSENINLRRDLSVVKSENNDLSRQLLQYRETGSENLKLTQENKLLHDKVKKMEEQIKFLRKQTDIWKEKAKEFMPTAIYKETVSLISTINPVGLAKTAIRQVKKMVDNNS